MRLCLNNINSYYGLSHILHDVSLYIDNNEVVSILGRNGAGKTTTLKSIMGLVSVKSGSITLDNTDITQLQTRSEENTSELQSLMRISYAVFCSKKKKKNKKKRV